MSTPQPVRDPSIPSPRGSNPVLAYASRGVGRHVFWTVYAACILAAVTAVAASFLFVWWTQYRPGAVTRASIQGMLVTTVQSLRSQVVLFKLQHNDRLPGVCPLVASGGPANANESIFWAQMTQFTDVDGNTSTIKTARYTYGPYFQSVQSNGLNGSKTIASAPRSGVGFVYDFAGGAGSGKVWGVDGSGALVRQ